MYLALCLEPDPVEGATHECTGNTVGSICEYSCDVGSRLEGESSKICKEDQFGQAYWSGNDAQCIQMCPQRVIHTPPLMVECTSGRDIGSSCKFECSDSAQLRVSHYYRVLV